MCVCLYGVVVCIMSVNERVYECVERGVVFVYMSEHACA